MSHEIIILDGGMGRELARRQAPFRQPEWSALALYQAPNAVQQIHQDFIQNGADVITTNSYAVVPFHIGEQRFQTDSAMLAKRAGQLAKNAVNQTACQAKIAGSLPPLFGSYRPDLFQAENVKYIAQPLIDNLAPYVDFWLCETQSSIAEPLAIKPLLPDDRPLWVSFTLEDENPSEIPCLRSGEHVKEAIEAMLTLGVEAVLFNCCQPEVIEQAIQITKQVLIQHQSSIRIGAYANAFPPQSKQATANEGLDDIRQDLDPQAYLAWSEKWVNAGASILGGCCGIGPEHINALAQRWKHAP